MKYHLTDILDIEELKKLCENFTNINGTVTAILDLEGNVLVATGWQPICTQFHRINSETKKRCTESDTILAGQLKDGHKYNVYKCRNGLVDVAMPIIVGGNHVGNLFTGQFFTEKADIEFFRNQARKYNFNETDYLSALEKAPIFNEDQVKANISFLVQLTEMIGNIGLKNLFSLEQTKQLEIERANLKAINEEYIALNEEYKVQNEELHQAKLTAEKSEQHNQMLFEILPIGLALTKITGELVYVNKAFTDIIGYSEKEALKLTYWDITPQKYAEQEQQQLDSLNTTGFYGPYEKEYRHKSGKLIPVRLRGRIVIINDEKFIWSSFEDISEKKKYEQELLFAKEKAEESDHLKTAFLQNMSHEIRTPMNAIMGFSDLLMNNFDDKPKLKMFSNIINQRCSDLLEIINDILDISKIESGQLPVNIEECNLIELFDELSDFFKEYQNRLGKQHINFSLKVQNQLPEIIISTDKIKLKQIFINLISNAFKFTDTGKIEGGCKFEENHKLVFYVSDTGIGIPSDKQATVFERFTQLHQSSRKNMGGTGLGLPIVKGLVGLLGGEIFLESESNKGSTFTFSFPYNTVSPFVHQPFVTRKQNYDGFVNKTILIVEDDYYNQEYLKEILSGTDLTILKAENGKEAVEISTSQPVDLVLMDIRLPDMDGYKATNQIKQHKPKLKIIAQTAYASHDERQKALYAGCDDYISKPTKKDLLLSMINNHLSIK
jgi:PAS domain S-box-containing protein